MNQDEVSVLVESQIELIEQRELIDLIRAHLVEPVRQSRDWDYGSEGQQFPCWVFWEHSPTDTAVCYCEHGFGPAMPWGLLGASPEASLGMDSQWYTFLEDAIRESMAWDGPNPPGYVVR